jgi:chemotaxis protein CheD
MPDTATLERTTSPVHVGMGQAAVGPAGGALQAVLGSCIGLALYHPRLKRSALAHVVLPDSHGNSAAPGKFADTAVPHMIALLAADGIPAAGLIAKIAGAASMFGNTGPIQIGESNIAAVKAALQKARITLAGEDVGGGKGRRMRVEVDTGRVTVEVVGRPSLVL